MLYTGLDLHRSFSYITTVDERGNIISQKKLPSNGEVVDFLKEFGEEMEIAIESTPSWFWLYDQLEEGGFDAKQCTKSQVVHRKPIWWSDPRS